MSDSDNHNEHDNNESEHHQTDEQTQNGKHYSIGIDLGTTHCVLSYADISDPDADEIVQEVSALPCQWCTRDCLNSNTPWKE